MKGVNLYFYVDKTVKLWKVSEKGWQVDGFNLKDNNGGYRDPASVTTLRVSPKNYNTSALVKTQFVRHVLFYRVPKLLNFYFDSRFPK